MKRDKLFMSIATFARMGAGLAMFILLARFFGPLQFGIIATATAYSGLINLITDFGLATYALREAGAEPSRSSSIVSQAMLCKLALVVISTFLCGFALLISKANVEQYAIFSLIYLSMTVVSCADILFIASRANGRYDIEATVVVFTSIIWMFVLVLVAALTKSAIYTSAAFFLTRVLYLVWALVGLRKWIFGPAWRTIHFRIILSTLKASYTYAADSLVTNLSNQIDVIAISILMSAEAVGIYQAGARLVQGIAPFSVMLSLVYLPKLAAASRIADRNALCSLGNRLNIEMTVIGLCGFVGFFFLGPLWTYHIYGPAYRDLISLWPGLSCFVLLRFCASAYGIQLAALGEIKIRIGAQVLAIVVICLGSSILYMTQNILYAPTILAFSSILTLAIYAEKIAKEIGNRTSISAITLICLMIFVFSVAYTFF